MNRPNQSRWQRSKNWPKTFKRKSNREHLPADMWIFAEGCSFCAHLHTGTSGIFRIFNIIILAGKPVLNLNKIYQTE